MATTQIPLVLVHGAWLSARSWESFEDYFGNRGFAVSAEGVTVIGKGVEVDK